MEPTLKYLKRRNLKTQNFFINFGRRIYKEIILFLGLTEKRHIKMAKESIKSLDAFEASPIPFGSKDSLLLANIRYQLNFSEALHHFMQADIKEEAKKIRNELLRRILGLKYRLEMVNGGLDKNPPQFDKINRLAELAAQWKTSQIAISDKEISSKDLNKFQEISQYGDLTNLILQDSAIREAFFIWSIRDKNEINAFVEFPATQMKIVECGISARIGKINPHCLKISKERNESDEIFKVMTLPFEGREYSILNDSLTITFKNEYTLTVRQIFQMFYDKNYRVGNLEFFQNGINNWNNHHLGPWNPAKGDFDSLDVNQPGWWQLLPLMEVLTLEKAKARYGNHLNGINWNMAVTASRLNQSLSYENTHAYLELAIPVGNDQYSIYDFGKFAFIFPSSFWEGLATFCYNAYATIAYPDENIFYTHRQHVQQSYEITPEQGFQCMEIIRKDILLSREGSLVFQIESENCAKWTYLILIAILGPEKVPNLFQLPLVYTEPAGAISLLFAILRPLPPAVQTFILNVMHLPFGARKNTYIIENGKRVGLSLEKHHFWRTSEVFLPALLHKQIESGKLSPIQPLSVASMKGGVMSQKQITEFDAYIIPYNEDLQPGIKFSVPHYVTQHSILESIATVNRSSYSYVNSVANLYTVVHAPPRPQKVAWLPIPITPSRL